MLAVQSLLPPSVAAARPTDASRRHGQAATIRSCRPTGLTNQAPRPMIWPRNFTIPEHWKQPTVPHLHLDLVLARPEVRLVVPRLRLVVRHLQVVEPGVVDADRPAPAAE
eukprot:5532384-Alexandrium_andersonii.AAC.1